MSWKSLGLRLTVRIAGRFPGLSYRVAQGAGTVAWRLRRKTRNRVIRNLLPACDGDVTKARRASRQAFRNVASYYVDLASLPRRDLAAYRARRLEVVNIERLALMDHPGPLMAVSAHMGNPELVLQTLLAHGRGLSALVEPLEPRDIAAAMLHLRSSAGARFHEANLAGLRHAVRDLRAGHVLGLLADRDIQGNGICVLFLGRRARFPRGPWELARREGALVVPAFCARLGGDRMRMVIEEPFEVERSEDADRDVRNAAVRYVALLEHHVRANPGQWSVLDDFWKRHACEDRQAEQ